MKIVILILLFYATSFGQNWNILFDDSGVDSIPSFHFIDVLNAELESYHEGYAVFTNVDSSFDVSAGTDSFKIGFASSYDVGTVRAELGDTVYVPISASALNSTIVSTTVTVAHKRSDTFSVTTVAIIPDHYYLVNKDGGKILMKGRTYAIKFKD